ncbi:MAG: hypothetical protein II956_01390 [Bacteroidales bacterium]|nr:hypothetical protein [Bacteroidales bacterium]
MEIFEKYNLKNNPFVITQTSTPNGFWIEGLGRDKCIEDILKRSAWLNSSKIVLNYGKYGYGKSYAAKHYCSDKVLKSLFDNKPIPYTLYLKFPSNDEPIKEIFQQIVDNFDFVEIKKVLAKCGAFNIGKAVSHCSDNPFIKNIISGIFSQMDDKLLKNDLKLYLFGNNDLKKLSSFGIQRNLSFDNDYISFIVALINFLTYKKLVYPCVVLWFDDAEGISTFSMYKIRLFNAAFCSLMENTSNSLIFMNFTESIIFNWKDINIYFQKSLESYIRNKIQFAVTDKNIYKLYVSKCISKERIHNNIDNNFYPYMEEVIDSVINDMGDYLSFRSCNLAFSDLLESGAETNETIIDISYYHRVKDNIWVLSLK